MCRPPEQVPDLKTFYGHGARGDNEAIHKGVAALQVCCMPTNGVLCPPVVPSARIFTLLACARGVQAMQSNPLHRMRLSHVVETLRLEHAHAGTTARRGRGHQW